MADSYTFFSPPGHARLASLNNFFSSYAPLRSLFTGYLCPCSCLTVIQSNILALLWVLSIYPKFLDILVGSQMERSVSVRSDKNNWDHLWRWSTWTSRTEIYHSILTNWLAALLSHRCRALGKGMQNGKVRSSWLARFNQKMLYHFTREI